MKTAVINIKTQPNVKKEAQRLAEELGLSLSGVLNGYLRHLVRAKAVYFDLEEKPSPFLLETLKKSEKDVAQGKVYSFKNAKEAILFLNKSLLTKGGHAR